MRIEEKEYTKSIDLSIWKKIFPFLAPRKNTLIMVVLMNLLCSVVDIIMPLFQRHAIDSFIEKNTLSGLGGFILLYIAVIVFQMCTVICFTRGCMKIDVETGRDMKRALFVHLQKLSFSYYNATPVGYILSRVMNDVARITELIAWDVIDMLWAISYVVGVLVAMLFLNWKLALVIMMIVPAIAMLTWYFQNRILTWNRQVRKINSKITSGYNEGIMGAKTVKSLVVEEKNFGEFSAVTEEMRSASIKAARLNAIYIPMVAFFGFLATALVLDRGGIMVLDGRLDLGTLAAFTAYAVGIFEPIQRLAGILSQCISAQANIERVTSLLEEKPQVVDSPEVLEKYGDFFNPHKENWEPIKGDIEFEHVSFQYPDGKEEVLTDFNLKIPAGTNVAIVGETGAGKSTLVNLVCRFFEPTKGRILIDGRDYRERSQLWLHSNIGYVLQNPHLFSGTVMENIRYGRLDATDEEVKAAARAVHADEVAEKLDKGYDSDVGEGGDRLSTGEKQLLSFARAVLADPAIFVLDEATSYIDTRTELKIKNAFATMMKGRTSFIVAHRLSTIQEADTILVMRDGNIIEQGSHEQLLKQNGFYATLYNSQFAG